MIKENVLQILKELPKGIELAAAAKTRTPGEVKEAVEAGIKIIGENYVQEAENAFKIIGTKARWHFIGHLQRNKIKKAIKIFDMIETVHSFKIAAEINKQCIKENMVMPILIEINSGREKQKFGVLPEKTLKLIKELSNLGNINIMGLMTMGPIPLTSFGYGTSPLAKDVKEIRSCFKVTKEAFEDIKMHNIPNVKMRYLSMGMSDTYKIAIEEGANIVRIGTAIFGKRQH